MADFAELANAIRVLSMDAVQKANSGHPGMPMGMADIATVLWQDFMNINPKNPNWFNRDRFVVSNGHGSMLLYALLHLAGFDLSADDIKQFRQWHSKTPGHPEVTDTPGVETTTGPLGQGLANAVGMALAEKILGAQFNQDGFNIVDHHTYCFTGDGGLMEGVSHEACALAGTWGLGKLIVFWDDNGISIDGKVQGWFTDDTPARFAAYHWHVIKEVDGHNPRAIKKAIEKARNENNKPTLICCRTKIGFGAPNLAGSAKTHGSPLGEAEIKATRDALNWPYAPFEIPDEIKNAWDLRARGEDKELLWNDTFAKYEQTHPQLAHEFLRRMHAVLPPQWSVKIKKVLNTIASESKAQATRKSSKMVLDYIGPLLHELLGGSADLTGSNLTLWNDAKTLSADNFDAQYIHYGVREFGMSAIMNGVALHKGFIPFGGTFLVFSDYARNAVRMSALMRQKVIYVYTHDSIGLGEDGPTHQPIEQLESLRLLPNLMLWRPADDLETAIAWQNAIEYQGPSALALTRQTTVNLKACERNIDAIQQGAYILWQSDEDAQAILIATGSEVGLALEAAKQLAAQAIPVQVVSMPCVKLFEAQTQTYQDAVLDPAIKKRIAIEAGCSRGWYKWVGEQGMVIGLDHFGASAPASKLFTEFGFSVENIVKCTQKIMEQ